MNRHWNEQDFLERLYGLMPPGSDRTTHAESCAACRDRLREFERRRAATAEPSPMDAESLAAQKRAVLARLDQPARSPWRWAPTLAAAALAIAAVLSFGPQGPAPVPQAVPAGTAVMLADEPLLAEIYAMGMAQEPRAASPIRGLFAVPEGEE